MNKFSKELIESLTEACEHAEGKPSPVRVHLIEAPKLSNSDDNPTVTPASRSTPLRRMG